MKPAEKIQTIINSEEAVRRKWFWGLSSVLSAAAIIIWLAYLQAALPRTKNAAEIKPAEKIENTENDTVGFFETLSRGISKIGEQAETGWQSIGGRASGYFSDFQELIKKERSVDFQPENDLEFAPVHVEEIPATPLPAATQ